MNEQYDSNNSEHTGAGNELARDAMRPEKQAPAQSIKRDLEDRIKFEDGIWKDYKPNADLTEEQLKRRLDYLYSIASGNGCYILDIKAHIAKLSEALNSIVEMPEASAYFTEEARYRGYLKMQEIAEKAQKGKK